MYVYLIVYFTKSLLFVFVIIIVLLFMKEIFYTVINEMLFIKV